MVSQGAFRLPSRDRLTEADQAELLARWPNGAVVEVETATNPHLNCFIATDDSGIHQFLFWRELDRQYVREETRTGLKDHRSVGAGAGAPGVAIAPRSLTIVHLRSEFLQIINCLEVYGNAKHCVL